MTDNKLQTQPKVVGFVAGEAERLIAQAIDKKVPVETMEKLLAMRRELKAEHAKEEFDKAMAAFQSKCPTIEKTKEVKTKAGKVAYKFAPIESIVEQVKEYIQKNGFSYSTNMDLIENGTTKVKVLVKVTHKAGHSEITEMTVPLGNKTDIMSNTQVVAAAQTFAKRYAFCNAFGILTGDEDNDAKPAEEMTEEETKSEVRMASEKQLDYITSLLQQKNYTVADLLVKYKIKTLIELTAEQASQIIENLMKLKPKEETVEGEVVEPEITDEDIEDFEKGK